MNGIFGDYAANIGMVSTGFDGTNLVIVQFFTLKTKKSESPPVFLFFEEEKESTATADDYNSFETQLHLQNFSVRERNKNVIMPCFGDNNYIYKLGKGPTETTLSGILIVGEKQKDFKDFMEKYENDIKKNHALATISTNFNKKITGFVSHMSLSVSTQSQAYYNISMSVIGRG